jgi:hypothetical protein
MFVIKDSNRKIFIRIFVFAFAFTYIFIMCYVFATYLKNPNFLIKTDLINFLTGAKIIKEGAIGNLYNTVTQLEYQNGIVGAENRTFLLPFRNFPITAIPYIPLLNLSLKESFVFVFCINIMLSLTFHFLFTRSFPKTVKSGYLLLLAVFFYPSVSNLIAGQHTGLILLILLFIFLYTRKQASFVAGILTSLLAIKPQYLLFAPFSLFAVKNKKSYSAGFIVGVSVFVLLNLLIAKNFRVFFDYPKFLLLTENPDFGSRPYQLFTFAGVINQVFPKINSTVVIFVNFLAYLSVIFLVLKKRIGRRLNDIFIIGILTTTLFSVHALSHDLIVFLLPIYFLYIEKKDKYFLYSGLIFIAAGILSLAPTSIVTTTLIFVILVSRFYSQRLSQLEQFRTKAVFK